MTPEEQRYWDDYYSHPRFTKGPVETGVPPVAQGGVESAKGALSPTPPNYPVIDPKTQYGMESGLLGTVGREAVIAGNQLGIGVAGLPMGALNLLWKGAHYLDPSDVGKAPAWTEAQGPGSYGEALTIPGFNPMSPGERVLAAGARQAGTALPFVATGAMGPIALGVNALGGGLGQGATEAGYPGVGAAIQFGTGLASGLGSARQMPGAPMWTNVGPLSVAEREAQHVADLRRMEMWSPLTHRMPFGSGVLLNYALVGGRRGTSPATSAAQRILGGTAGAAVGTGSAVENAPPPMYYSAPPEFAPR